MTAFRPDSSALCAQTDPDEWFQTKGGRNTTQAAKKMCAGCPLLDPCRTYALRVKGLAGVWGGTSPTDRARLQAELGIETVPVVLFDAHSPDAAAERWAVAS